MLIQPQDFNWQAANEAHLKQTLQFSKPDSDAYKMALAELKRRGVTDLDLKPSKG